MLARTPESDTAALIRAYAERAIEDCGDEDAAPAIFIAVREAVIDSETCYLGRAILDRHHALADLPCRIGGKHADPDLVDLAKRLGWTA